ncbi:hypothetical protein PsorP6_012196 [Peronosclerospora sorghi]|uniref:Uncharacterized protein n=1 Tax=Peronosclerospora sorghi TaxID=230839 RepID=A0ACC0WI28_9STRA|nr:hypothetical protein PsorP6_012196 [Peronosclerospora sorghi]
MFSHQQENGQSLERDERAADLGTNAAHVELTSLSLRVEQMYPQPSSQVLFSHSNKLTVCRLIFIVFDDLFCNGGAGPPSANSGSKPIDSLCQMELLDIRHTFKDQAQHLRHQNPDARTEKNSGIQWSLWYITLWQSREKKFQASLGVKNLQYPEAIRRYLNNSLSPSTSTSGIQWSLCAPMPRKKNKK